MDYKLTYPSGTATAMLINSFHTTTGAELAGYVVEFNTGPVRNIPYLNFYKYPTS